MSNEAIITQLANINTRLDEGINIRGSVNGSSQKNIPLIRTDNNGQLIVNADISGSVKLNDKTSSILVYGKNGSSNYAVSVDTSGTVNVKDTGANSYLQSIDMKLTSTANKLQVQDTAVNNSLTTIITKLNSIITPTRYGSHNNVYSGSLVQNAMSTALDVTLFKTAVLSYYDTSHTLNNTLQIIATSSSNPSTGTYDYIGLLIPITNTTTSKRYASTTLELSPFTYLKIVNLSTDTINGISCSLYGSG